MTQDEVAEMICDQVLKSTSLDTSDDKLIALIDEAVKSQAECIAAIIELRETIEKKGIEL